jgi:YihY family inner membrane protein
MGTSSRVPETTTISGDELSADDALTALRRYGRWNLVKNSFIRFRYADGFSHARALALQLCLSFIPLTIAVVGLASAVHQQKVGQVIIQTVAGVLPGKDQGDMVEQAAQRTHDQGVTGGHLALWLGLLAAIVALTTAMGQIERGANRIYGIERDRPALRKYRRALVMAMTAGLLLQLGFVVIIAGDALGESLAATYGLGDTFKTVWTIGSWPVGVLLAWASFTVVLEHAPRRRQPAFSWLAFGSAVALVLWLMLTGLFALYVLKSGSFGSTYGPLTGIFALLLWANLSSVALLLGVAFAAQLEAVRAGAPEPTAGDPLSADSGKSSQRKAADRVPGEPTAPMAVLHR